MKKLTRVFACAAAAAVMTVSSGMFSVTAAADWHKTDSGYYYTDSDGDKLTGWQTIGSGKYYFNSKGYAVTGFKTIKGKKYYFIPSKKGRMGTGWLKIGKSKYYFGTDGVMRTGWKKLGGKTYYFGSDGKMRTGKVKIDGETYTFSSAGVLKSTGDTTSSAGGFSSNPMGKSKWGVSSDKFLSDNNIKDYYVTKENNLTFYAFLSGNYLGESVKVGAGFENDKLVVIMVFPDDNDISSTVRNKLSKLYGESYLQGEKEVWFTDNEIVICGDNDGAQAIGFYEYEFAASIIDNKVEAGR